MEFGEASSVMETMSTIRVAVAARDALASDGVAVEDAEDSECFFFSRRELFFSVSHYL